MERRWRKVRKQGKTLAQLDPQNRHEAADFQVKKLRYAAELEFIFRKAGIEASEEICGCAQDGLGELNDIVVDEHIIAATRA